MQALRKRPVSPCKPRLSPYRVCVSTIKKRALCGISAPLYVNCSSIALDVVYTLNKQRTSPVESER